MPELPDVEAYLHALRRRVQDRPLTSTSVRGPSLLRSFEPPLEAAIGLRVMALSRLGKRIVFTLENDLFLVLHLMIAGRLQWKESGPPPRGRIVQAVFGFPDGSLVLTEAGTKRRATLHLVAGREALAGHDPGGAEVAEIDAARFDELLRRENRTLKRVLTSPRIFAGIGNAYSDEILHAAGLSPVRRSRQLGPEESGRLYAAARDTLETWRERLCARFDTKFPGPGQITAFRPEFAVHGRYGKPCPACNTTVQRIRYADSETNYCPACQTGGRVLADRSLSRLLKDDWPGVLEE